MMSSGGEPRVPPLNLTDPPLQDPPLQIIVDGTQELVIGSPVPLPSHDRSHHSPDPEDHDEDNRSVSPCPSITVDACERREEEEVGDAQEEADPEAPHRLSLPKRRHSDVSQHTVMYYKHNLLGSRSENVLFTFHNSLDLGAGSSPGFLDLPGSRLRGKREDSHAVAALCSPETHRRKKQWTKDGKTDAKS